MTLSAEPRLAIIARRPGGRRTASLRYQIDEGLLPLNRDGAAGWIVGDRLWVVVKRALEAGCVPTAALVVIDRVPDVAALLDCAADEVVFTGGVT